jgi:hypothetical protein
MPCRTRTTIWVITKNGRRKNLLKQDEALTLQVPGKDPGGYPTGEGEVQVVRGTPHPHMNCKAIPFAG